MSFLNVQLYSATLPNYDTDKEKEPEFDESMDANDPNNFNDDDEIITVRR